jgi:ribosome-associated protein
MNRIEAFARLMDVVQSVAKPPKKRRPTKPTFASKQRRLEGKKKLSEIKSGRSKVL